MKKFFALIFISASVYFVSWSIVYSFGINNLSIQSEDTLPAMFLPVSIIKDKTFYADKYYDMILRRYPQPDDKSFRKNLTPYYFRKIQNHYISAFPIMSGILSIPIYFILLPFGLRISFENITILAHASASLIVAFSGAFLFLLLKKHFLSEKKALLLTIIYLFGTINYALLSQALWQHGTLEFFLILGLYFLFNSFTENKIGRLCTNIFFSGVFFGFALISRPTAVIALAFISLLIVEKFGKSLKKVLAMVLVFSAGVSFPLFFFFWYNAKYYLSVFNQGYSSQVFTNWLSKFPEGFVGVWISPSKGILIYSPILIFSLIGFMLSVRKSLWKNNLKYIVFFAIVVVHTLVISRWKHWYGGWSFGYRMSSDVLPFFILLLVPYLNSQMYARTKKLFYALFAVSVLVQIFGIVFFDGVWHAAFDKGFRNTGWLWSLRDSEFVFNITRLLVKLGLYGQVQYSLPFKSVVGLSYLDE